MGIFPRVDMIINVTREGGLLEGFRLIFLESNPPVIIESSSQTWFYVESHMIHGRPGKVCSFLEPCAQGLRSLRPLRARNITDG